MGRFGRRAQRPRVRRFRMLRDPRAHARGWSFLTPIFEQLNHALHAGRGAGDFRRGVGFALADDAHQINSAVFGDDLDVVRRETTGVGEKAGFHFRGDRGIVAAGAERAIARSDGRVKNVFNEIAIAGNSSLGSRGNDTAITSKVKTRFLANAGRFSPNHIKVVTENSTVYLMGIVTKSEADAATEVASTTAGVQRVVKLFEYKN